MNYLDVQTHIFTYPLNENYLTVAEVNPCMNTFENAAANGVAWLDGSIYSYELEFPATRVFTVDTGTTCEENDSDDVIVFNNDGIIMDCDTSPFSFCEGILSFSSEETSWEGVHEFSALGFTWYVLDPLETEEAERLEIVIALEAETNARKSSTECASMEEVFDLDP